LPCNHLLALRAKRNNLKIITRRIFANLLAQFEGAFGRITMNFETLAREAVDCAYHIHRVLGPGLLESVYEMVLVKSLERRGFRVECQKPISFTYDDMTFSDAFRADVLVEDKLLIELKSVENIAPVHAKQLLTYLRLMNLPLGLLLNFGAATLKDGVQRVVNNHTETKSSHLRLHE
jgi:iron complex transport system substrate-binding protein